MPLWTSTNRVEWIFRYKFEDEIVTKVEGKVLEDVFGGQEKV